MSNDIDNVTPKGVLLVVSGPSGAGKGTICQMLRDQLPDLGYSISVTTRAPRTCEVDGESYFFMTIPEVKQMIEKGDLLEYAEVYGNYYGTPRKYVEEQLESGRDVLLEIDIQGALQIKKRFPEGVFVFIVPPSLDELSARIYKRGTDSEDVIKRRMASAASELTYAAEYDYTHIFHRGTDGNRHLQDYRRSRNGTVQAVTPIRSGLFPRNHFSSIHY